MQLRRRKLFRKRLFGQVDFLQKLLCLSDILAAGKHKGYEFILRHICRPLYGTVVLGVSDKVQSRHTQPLFVCGIVKERESVCNVSHSYYGIVAFAFFAFEIKNKISRNNGHFFSIGKFIIEGSSHVKIAGFQGGGGAHVFSLLF